jgi:hypothetical protein
VVEDLPLDPKVKGSCPGKKGYLSPIVVSNETARFKKCKQLLKYQHFLLLKDIWWSKL